MKNYKQNRAGSALLAVIITIFTLFSSGCVTVQSFPKAARAGDTIMLAVGSPEGMVATNTSVLFQPGSGSQVSVPIRSIFKLYPDKTSSAWLETDAVNVENQTGHGPWTTIIALDLPPTLPDGPGTLQISTAATYPPSPARNINDSLISMEILPAAAGAGSPDPFSYEIAANLPVAGDLSLLEPQRRLVVKPDFTGLQASSYGAIEIKISIPQLNQQLAGDFNIIVDEKVQLSAADVQMQMVWSVKGNDLVVNLISPSGGLGYQHAHFYLVSSNLIALIDAGLVNPAGLTPIVTYYDINGVEMLDSNSFVVLDET